MKRKHWITLTVSSILGLAGFWPSMVPTDDAFGASLRRSFASSRHLG